MSTRNSFIRIKGNGNMPHGNVRPVGHRPGVVQPFARRETRSPVTPPQKSRVPSNAHIFYQDKHGITVYAVPPPKPTEPTEPREVAAVPPPPPVTAMQETAVSAITTAGPSPQVMEETQEGEDQIVDATFEK